MCLLQCIRLTTIGQSLDMLSQVKDGAGATGATGAAGKPITLDDFTMKLYNNIVTHKTAYYSFFFPVQIGMALVI